MTDFRINVIVDPKSAVTGMDKVDNRLKKTESNAKRLQSTLARAFTLVGILAVTREIGLMADALTNASNRIRLVTRDAVQLNAVMSELFDISVRTRTSFEATSTIFSRTALSVRDLGLSQRETLNFTESLNQAIVLSGVKAQEANAGLIQLSQGLASGTLRGDELRSVLEQLPKVADVIAQQMGVTRGELRLLGQEGRISAETVILAFKNAAEELERDFDSAIPTISQAFSVLRSNTIRLIGDADKATGATEKLSRSIIALAGNLDNLARFAIVAGAALAGPFVKGGIVLATRGIAALGVAMAANPIGLFVIALSAGIAALLQFGDELTVTADGMVTLKDVTLATFDFIMDSIQPVVDALTEGFEIAINFIVNAFSSLNITFSSVLGFVKTFVNGFIGLFVGLGRAVSSVFKDIGKIIRSVVGEELIGKLNDNIKATVDFAIKGFDLIQKFANRVLLSLGILTEAVKSAVEDLELPEIDASFVGNMIRVGANAKSAFLEGFNQDFVGDFASIVAPALATIDANARKIAAKRTAQPATADPGLDQAGDRVERLPFALQEQLRLLEEETRILQLNNKERGIQNELLDIEERLRSSNTTLTDSQRELLESAIRTTQAYREQAEVLDSIIGPQEEIQTRMEALVALYDRGSISLSQFNDQMIQLALTQSALNIEQGEGSFFDGFLVGMEQSLEAVRNFGSEAGAVFADFFTQTSEGFADAIANAIVFGGSFKEAIGNVARQALASLLSGLINLGIQFVLNATLGQSLAAAATAAGVAEAAILGAAWAAPAALVSLASFGANAAPASAGIASTVALSQGLALAGFADGGFVSGAGGPRSDSIPAMLSNGEFVVNAQATSRFRPQLEAMNNPANTQGGNNTTSSTAASPSAAQQEGQGNSTRIVNVLDPSLVGNFLTSASGEKVLVNVIERNSSSISQILRNT